MNSSKFFQNKSCEYFPCHNCDTESFNCLFCYCPLYPLKSSCGGNFYYSEDGTKCCENCTIPHSKGGYEFIQKHIDDVVDMQKKN